MHASQSAASTQKKNPEQVRVQRYVMTPSNVSSPAAFGAEVDDDVAEKCYCDKRDRPPNDRKRAEKT